MASQALAPVDETRQAIASFNNQLQTRAEQFKMVLPAHIKPEQFQRTVITAVQSDPELLKADRQSLLLACMKAAQDGLLPDKREAALVIFSTSTKQGNEWVKVKQVQYMPMVFGLRKKILQSGEISAIETNVVYRAELESGRFIYEGGTEAMLRHKPDLMLSDEQITDDEIVAAYSVAVMKDGTKSFEVMRRSEINKVRQRSQTGATGQVGKFGSMKGKPIEPKGPWVDWFSEMARKTVMRRHSKTLPMSGDLIDVEARDEEIAARSTQALLGSAQADAPERLVPPTRDDAEEVPHDPETGEIADEEDPDVARAADDEALAGREGRDDRDMGEGNNDTLAGHPFRATADALIARAGSVELLADLTKVEADLAKDREAAPEELVAEVETAIAEGKARFGKGGES